MKVEKDFEIKEKEGGGRNKKKNEEDKGEEKLKNEKM